MPFGIINSPGTFWLVRYVRLSTVKCSCSFYYLHDILIYSKTIEEHIEHVNNDLSLLPTVGVTMKFTKLFFLTNTSDYLGHVIRPERLQIASNKTEAIHGLKTPTGRIVPCISQIYNLFLLLSLYM